MISAIYDIGLNNKCHIALALDRVRVRVCVWVTLRYSGIAIGCAGCTMQYGPRRSEGLLEVKASVRVRLGLGLD